MRKILIYIPNWIGDAVMAIPMVRETRRVYPDDELTLFAREWVSPVFQYLRGIDKIISFSREEIKRRKSKRTLIHHLRQGQYDTVYILPDSFSTSWIMYNARVKERIGYRNEFRSWMLTRSKSLRETRGIHRSDKYIQLLQHLGGELRYGTPPRFQTTGTGDTDTLAGWDSTKVQIGINPNAVATSRRWPIPYWIRLMNSLGEESRQFVLFGGPGDRDRAKMIARKTSAEIINLAGRCTLDESIRYISRCNLFISNDSGPMHIADAAGVPTLGFIGAADITATGLRNSHSKNLYAGVYCSPCLKNHCINKKEPLICLHAIPPELVTEEAEYLLKHNTFRN